MTIKSLNFNEELPKLSFQIAKMIAAFNYLLIKSEDLDLSIEKLVNNNLTELIKFLNVATKYLRQEIPEFKFVQEGEEKMTLLEFLKEKAPEHKFLFEFEPGYVSVIYNPFTEIMGAKFSLDDCKNITIGDIYEVCEKNLNAAKKLK
jgi:hypothetical protein